MPKKRLTCFPNSASSSTQPLSQYFAFRSNRSPWSYSAPMPLFQTLQFHPHLFNVSSMQHVLDAYKYQRGRPLEVRSNQSWHMLNEHIGQMHKAPIPGMPKGARGIIMLKALTIGSGGRSARALARLSSSIFFLYSGSVLYFFTFALRAFTS